MKTPNEKETDKRMSSLLSVVERQAVGPEIATVIAIGLEAYAA